MRLGTADDEPDRIVPPECSFEPWLSRGAELDGDRAGDLCLGMVSPAARNPPPRIRHGCRGGFAARGRTFAHV